MPAHALALKAAGMAAVGWLVCHHGCGKTSENGKIFLGDTRCIVNVQINQLDQAANVGIVFQVISNEAGNCLVTLMLADAFRQHQHYGY